MCCLCKECTSRRESVKKLKAWREEMRRIVPDFGEFDWEDLEAQDRKSRESKFSNGNLKGRQAV